MRRSKPEIEVEADVEAIARAGFAAARRGDAPALADLLDRGLPPDLRNEKGDSLLMLACYHGGTEAARLLLQRGADPDLANDRGQTPLAGAAFKGDLAVAGALLDHGAAIDGTTADGRTPLAFAVMFGRAEMVVYLLSRGADPASAAAPVRGGPPETRRRRPRNHRARPARAGP